MTWFDREVATTVEQVTGGTFAGIPGDAVMDIWIWLVRPDRKLAALTRGAATGWRGQRFYAFFLHSNLHYGRFKKIVSSLREDREMRVIEWPW